MNGELNYTLLPPGKAFPEGQRKRPVRKRTGLSKSDMKTQAVVAGAVSAAATGPVSSTNSRIAIWATSP